MRAELPIRILPSEFPLDGSPLGVSSLLPCIDLGLQGFCGVNSPIQALTGEDADFDFGHVQPARVLGRVVELHSAQQPGGPALSQHVVEAFLEVDIQVVQNEVNATGLGACPREQVVDEGDEVNLSPALGDRDHAPSGLGLNGHEQVGGAMSRVLIVLLGRGLWCHGQRLAAVSDQLQALLVDADHWLGLAHWPSVQLQQAVHAPAVLLGQHSDAPHQPTPGFEVVFLASVAPFPDSHRPDQAPAGRRARARSPSSVAGPVGAKSRQAPRLVPVHPCRTAPVGQNATDRTPPAPSPLADTPLVCATPQCAPPQARP